MQPQTTPLDGAYGDALLDADTARRVTAARVLLERAHYDLEEIERDTDRAVRERLEETSMLVALALEELPGS